MTSQVKFYRGFPAFPPGAGGLFFHPAVLRRISHGLPGRFVWSCVEFRVTRATRHILEQLRG